MNPYPAPDAHDDDISVVALANTLLRHRILVLGLPLLAMVVTAVIVLALPREYVATSSFTPSRSDNGLRSAAGMAGLAAQFGVRVPGGGDAESPEFYAAVIRSRGLLREVAGASYPVPGDEAGDTVEVTLADWYGVRSPDPGTRLRAAVGRLDEDLEVSTDATTGTVTVRTYATDPGVAARINARILERVNDFNIRKRQSQAAAERRFVEERIEQARSELEQAETALQTFMERNAYYEQSPTLRARAGRLQRQVNLHQEVYTSLATLLEEKKLEEVRNTPLITIVEQPADTVRPEPRRLPVWVILAGIAAGLVATALAFIWDFARRQPEEHPEDVAEFRRLVRDARRVRRQD